MHTKTSDFQAIHHKNLLIVIFKHISHVQQALHRPHIEYEGQELRGPLKGVNFPSVHYKAWISRNSLSQEEEQVAMLVEPETEYVIAFVQGDSSTFLHEYAHAMYFLSAEYRKVVQSCWEGLDNETRKYIEKQLVLFKYRPDVFVDEFQAYVVEGPGEFGKKVTLRLKLVHKKLRASLGSLPVITAPVTN